MLTSDAVSGVAVLPDVDSLIYEEADDAWWLLQIGPPVLKIWTDDDYAED